MAKHLIPLCPFRKRTLGSLIRMKHVLGYQAKDRVRPVSSRYHGFTQRDPRHIVRLNARARQPAKGTEVSVIVTNLSLTGCKLESLTALDPKVPVLISCRHNPNIKAQIMWSKTGSHGCKFEKALCDETLSALHSQT